jgi:hypothetical protein
MKRKLDIVVRAAFMAGLMVLAGCGDGSVTQSNGDDVNDDQQDVEPQEQCFDSDGDGYGNGPDCLGIDCNDSSAAINPAAQEICGNDVDENCDQVKDQCPDPCVDQDKDGYLGKTVECSKGDDCDDFDNDVHPKALDNCGNQVDEDCDGKDLECPKECKDLDNDGYVAKSADCPEGTDCDDGDNDVHPNAVEICSNQADENCDGKDEECPPECLDNDNDGYGSGKDCKDYDCNDGNPAMHPGAVEECENGLDDDCVDGDAPCPETCDDQDEDGFGVGGACVVQDCDDTNPNINPGAVETCDNQVDEDCNGVDLVCVTCTDNDGDGYGTGDSCIGPDCDDSNPLVNPVAEEICGNGIDEDCDGEDCPKDCLDADLDGYGQGPQCEGADCNDADAFVHPGAFEICENGSDEDCDGKDADCPAANCEDDYDCKSQELCDQATGTCRLAKVWEWWAPTFYVDTDTAGKGLDLPRAANFDGDWNAQNNAANMKASNATPVIYYTFVKTSTHWYLGYYLFFPTRWATWFLDPSYENTMRSVLLVVEQDGSTYGKLVLVETQTEDTFFQFAPQGNGLSGAAAIDGKINWDLFFPTDHHPVMYVHSKDHGIWADAYLWNNVTNWEIKGFPGGDGVVYRFGNTAENPAYDTDEVYYELQAVKETLWEKKNEIGAGKLFNEFGHFNYASKTSEKCLAPWRLYDFNVPLEPQGEVMWNPADFVRRHFLYGWVLFSHTYIYNPYVVKVTLLDLMLYVTADPFNGNADPYVNLYLYDGSGYEELMLSIFNGFQNNWYKDGVAPNTLLDLQTELGGRNYFYGFVYPNKSYFGIQIRDYDGGWSGDDWLMDEAKTAYYNFVGTELKNWGKSDSYIKVELLQ